MLKPKLFTTLKDYSKEQFYADVSAGLIVGVVALPLAIAFGIASGVTPERGLITAIIAGFLISALGGSRVQIGGPTAAFVIIVYGIVQKYGVEGLTIATIMAGVILVIMGLAKFGSAIKFIPHPVIVGFTSGIAITIFLSQIKDFLGLNMGNVPSNFIDKFVAYEKHITGVNWYAAVISVACVHIIVFWKKIPAIGRKIPGSLIALILATVAVSFFNLPVETIGSKFGELTAIIHAPSIPLIDFETIRNLIGPATAIAILAGIEALLSAVVSDGMIGGRHRSNMELVATGIANIFAPIFGGIPATGAIARTATNIKNGGRTPVAGITHAIVLLLIVVFFGKLAGLIPLACLSAILMVVAYNMSEWRTFKAILKSPASDIIVLMTTFFLTVVFDLTVAIEIGMITAVFLFIRRMSLVSNVNVITNELNDDLADDYEKKDKYDIGSRIVPEGVEVYEINGPLFFGAAYKFEEAIKQIQKKPKILVIRLRNVPAIDSTGIRVLEQVYDDSVKKGIQLILSGVAPQPLVALDKAGLRKKVGDNNILKNIDETLNRAREILNLPKLKRKIEIGVTEVRAVNRGTGLAH
ncbi:STAS domain-containing protein [Candidatus Woesearchaeota archaeon]|nr:STAS domain-containing protein [Candidatus Woesearchaeota archaeon]